MADASGILASRLLAYRSAKDAHRATRGVVKANLQATTADLKAYVASRQSVRARILAAARHLVGR
jgi:hypothetical protein